MTTMVGVPSGLHELQRTAGPSEVSRLSQHLLVIVSAGYIAAYEDSYITALGLQIKQGLPSHDIRTVLASNSAQANTVKRVFRRIMATYATCKDQAPIHALIYDNHVPFSHRPQGMLPPLLEAGTEDEAGCITNGRKDFADFHHKRAPDVLLLAESPGDIGPTLQLSGQFFGTLGRQHKALLWDANGDGDPKALGPMSAAIAQAMQDDASIVTIQWTSEPALG